jgi:hypothetical protein
MGEGQIEGEGEGSNQWASGRLRMRTKVVVIIHVIVTKRCIYVNNEIYNSCYNENAL